jgi:hypothetical protein
MKLMLLGFPLSIAEQKILIYFHFTVVAFEDIKNNCIRSDSWLPLLNNFMIEEASMYEKARIYDLISTPLRNETNLFEISEIKSVKI